MLLLKWEGQRELVESRRKRQGLRWGARRLVSLASRPAAGRSAVLPVHNRRKCCVARSRIRQLPRLKAREQTLQERNSRGGVGGQLGSSTGHRARRR